MRFAVLSRRLGVPDRFKTVPGTLGKSRKSHGPGPGGEGREDTPSRVYGAETAVPEATWPWSVVTTEEEAACPFLRRARPRASGIASEAAGTPGRVCAGRGAVLRGVHGRVPSAAIDVPNWDALAVPPAPRGFKPGRAGRRVTSFREGS